MNVEVRPGELLELALQVAREAAELVRTMRTQGVDVAGTKSSDIDIWTLADQASEELIRSRLLAARPDDGFLGEEGSSRAGSSGVRWVVDPIDGTVNYLYGIPQYAVSIGVVTADPAAGPAAGTAVAGVVLAVATGDEYAATLGGGATLNGRPIAVRPVVPLARTLVGTGFNYETDVKTRQVDAVAAMLPQVRDIRRMGCCSLDLCAVAAGTLDAYVEEGVMPWDHAAGGLVAREAGARVEVTTGASGKALLICTGAAGFDAFRTLVSACGFVGPEGE